MSKYALVNNNTVTAIIDIESEEYTDYIKTNDMVIDIDGQIPQPTIGCVLNGNKLELPQGASSREEFELDLASRKTDFGIRIARVAVDKIGARNKILNKTGAQVSALLNQLLGVKLLLETGALGTARYSCVQLKTVYTEYSDIFDYIISEVNAFENSSGL